VQTYISFYHLQLIVTFENVLKRNRSRAGHDAKNATNLNTSDKLRYLSPS